MDVGSWLRELGLEQYAAAFADNDIDAETLPSLTADDLRELGVASLGHRKKLLAAIAALRTEPTPPDPASDPMADAEGEQREVTVLFADLSSFTRLSADLGAEHTHALLNQYFDAADTVVAAYGGAIDKHIGDSVMGVFGAPIAHSNDPERAVRAALEIQQATTRLGEQFGRNLQVHIGIANGQVVASGTGSDTHRQYTVIGDSVNVAARLQDLAGPGEIWISDRVYRSVRVDLECESLGGVEVKGLDAPLVAWRVQALHDGMPAQAPSKLVGRRNELNQFRGILRACLDTGQGQAIYVRGETGIGKTRLVSEFGTIAAAEGFGCHSVLVLDFGVGKGQDPIRSIVRSLLDVPAGSGAAVDQAAIDQVIEAGRLHADQRPYLNDLLDLPQPGEQRVLYDAMTEAARRASKHQLVVDLIKTLSAQAPLLLVVDNVHWADSITLAYLAAITSVARACPAVLVMTSRIDDDPLDAAWRSSVQGAALMTIDLGPLQKDEAIAMAGAFVDRAHRFALECVERAEGNPLFLEQLLRNAEESEAREIPASIHSLVLARVDRLPAEDKRALQAAAVIGQRFSLDMLRSLLDQPSYDAARLVQHYLVRPEGEEYLFAHALIQEGVYASLLTRRRQALHGRAAQWCAERDPILRARHLDRAEDALAPQAYLQAAHIQAANFRDLPALGLVERGLEIASTRIDQLALTALQGRLLHDLGRSPDSVEAYQRALDLADDDNQRCSIWIGLAAAMRIVDRLDEALDVLDRAETVATREYLLTELARVHHLRGNVYFPLGRIEECHEEHQMALDYARQAGSRELEAQALSGLADANSLRARINTAHNHFHHAIVIARANGFGRIEVANRHMRGIMRYYQNDLLGAAEDCLAGAEGATKVAHQRAEMVARAACGYVLTELGDFAEARAQCEQALDLARRLGAGRFESSTLRHLGRVLAAEGEVDAALELFEQSYAIAKEAGLAFSGPWALGGIAVYTADPEARRRALAEGEAILAEGCPFHNYFWFYRDGMEAGLDGGMWDEVERYAAALEAFTRAEPVPWTTFFIERGRALATIGRGERDNKVFEQLERLRAEAERAGFKLILPGLESALANMTVASAGD